MQGINEACISYALWSHACVTFLMKRGIGKTRTRSNARLEIVKTRLRFFYSFFHHEGHICVSESSAYDQWVCAAHYSILKHNKNIYCQTFSFCVSFEHRSDFNEFYDSVIYHCLNSNLQYWWSCGDDWTVCDLTWPDLWLDLVWSGLHSRLPSSLLI